MSELLLIRHGQASFAADDYDVLSPVGHEQARALGRTLASRGVRLDALYSGPRRRQLDTARGIREALGCGEPVVVEELDEFPFEQILRDAIPKLLAEQPHLDGEHHRPEIADHLFGEAMSRWAHGRLDGDYESYASFRARVERGIDRLVDAEAALGRGRTVAAVTSGGPIAVALRRAFGLTEAASLELQVVTANASVTRFKFRRGRLTATGWNDVAHLDAPQITLR